jgi:superfamily II helicase
VADRERERERESDMKKKKKKKSTSKAAAAHQFTRPIHVRSRSEKRKKIRMNEWSLECMDRGENEVVGYFGLCFLCHMSFVVVFSEEEAPRALSGHVEIKRL